MLNGLVCAIVGHKFPWMPPPIDEQPKVNPVVLLTPVVEMGDMRGNPTGRMIVCERCGCWVWRTERQITKSNKKHMKKTDRVINRKERRK